MPADKIEEFIKLKPESYTYLKSLNLNRNIEDSSSNMNYEVEMIFNKAIGHSSEKLKIKFTNVVNLKVGDLNDLFGFFLMITDIRDWQHEGVKYRVTEEEYSAFSFNCGEFYAEVLD
ncbi:hypothetical protein KQY10_01545 [Leptospira interrogans]|uniref:Uncharacterized protein n=1 Tax=Leptospira interrogans serovar Hardjo str. Norma TaxID=1279460 RepID=A0A0M5L7Q3_LEPIR|nr:MULTISPECIES: hypothetical protein [Leptospira]ALE39116.1 hypothetical protein G436_1928 [Leptospira interrogans serovar Hardjo str. Norma]EKO95528.1 hypothetical protein LEP1GSC057_1380 [Leptospira interrogans str. Brem 329]MCD1164330.1 hypothetical protein [Leptospira interrogans]MCH1886162.1 hypothetical protein [Leptospira interrogans]MCH1892399.1 hypothetical protein [Leptospira interrogans]